MLTRHDVPEPSHNETDADSISFIVVKFWHTVAILHGVQWNIPSEMPWVFKVNATEV